MGNKNHTNNHRSLQTHQKRPVINIPAQNHVQQSTKICPKCSTVLPANTTPNQLANHLFQCIQQNLILINTETKLSPDKNVSIQYEKVPVDNTLTKYKWQKKPIMLIDKKIFNESAKAIKKLKFQQKQAWFRNKLQKKRIGWQNGADWMKLERSNIFLTSFMQSKKVKIQFIGEKVNDAGGLLRQWIHMVIKQVFDESTGIFSIANTDQIMYKLKWDQDLDQEFSTPLFQLFGTILGKAIFQRIPMESYLDRTILRQICQDNVKIQDIYGYDIELYKNWIYILQSEHLDQLQTYFVIHKDIGETVQDIELMKNGKNIKVTLQNKFKYIDLCIQIQTIQKVKRSIQCIKKGMYRVVPAELLSIFEPYQLEMLLYGISFIDIKDWKQNTTYKAPYTQNNKIIQWFWKVMQKFDQDQLANILHFCTGSTRTPVTGFKKLQSNRGNYSKFMIQSTAFVKTNPYPKGHTCFNRLQLPLYPDQKTLEVYLTAISKSNLDGVFGLD